MYRHIEIYSEMNTKKEIIIIMMMMMMMMISDCGVYLAIQTGWRTPNLGHRDPLAPKRRLSYQPTKIAKNVHML